jgi:ketosteroid isomerase-like protein
MATNAERAREIFETLWARREIDRVDELVAPDAVIHDPFRGLLDRTGFEDMLASSGIALPELQITVDEVVEAGDRVVIRWSGLPSGSEGVADGVTGLSLLTLRDGKLAEQWSAWDTPRFGEAFGLLPHGTQAVFAFDRATPPA